MMIPKKKKDRIRKTACLLLAVILWIPFLSIGDGKAAAAGGWSMVDGNGLNVNPANRAEYPAMAEFNGEVYVAWQEKIIGNNPNQIRIKKYNGTGWTSVDGNGPNGINMNSGNAGTRPTMAVYDGALYVAWVEGVTSSLGQIRVKKYSNTGWSTAEGSSTGLNYDGNNGANSPTLAVYNNALYASWSEAGKIYVKKYSGTEWTSVDGGANGLNVNPSDGASYPALAVMGNDLYAVWSEYNGTVEVLRAKKYNGTGWMTIDGGGLNDNMNSRAFSPSLAADNETLYLAWHEPTFRLGTDDRIRVMKYENNAWTSLGGANGINVDPAFRANYVKLAVVNHEVYAVWSENTGLWAGGRPVFKIRAKKYTGSGWTSAEVGLNGLIADPAKTAIYPAITSLNNAIFVAWQEQSSTVDQVRVAMLPPPAVNSVTVTPNPVTLAQGGSKQLQATVDAQGGAAETVTWTSSDSSNKVAVSSTGNVTVTADATPGDYTIMATSTFNNSKIGTATITVVPPTVNSVSVSPVRANIMQGGSRQFNTLVNVVEGTDKTLTWTSSDSSNKVAVSAGNVTVALDAVPGIYTITATSTVDSSKKGTVEITVLAAPAINSVTVAPGTSNVVQGGSKQLTASVDAVGGAATTVTWTSSDVTNKVAVNSSGKVTVAADAELGDYTITATSTVNNAKKGTATITVTAPPVPETKPAAEIDYVLEQLTGLKPNEAYTINGTSVTADGSGKVTINSSWPGTSVSIVKKGDGTTTTDSVAQILSLPARPTKPNAGKTNETTFNGNDGTLTNVTSEMEYKKGTGGSWTEFTGEDVTGLEPDTYYVRVKATFSSFASAAQTVTVAAFVAPPEATPAAKIDYAAEQLKELEPTSTYIINGTEVTTDDTGKLAINGSWLGSTVSVVKKGNGTSKANSAAQTLSLPARPATPNTGKTDETSINGNNGSLTNLTSAMEYKRGAAGSWTDVTGTSITGQAPDTYYVRFKATSSSFASEAQEVTIATFGSTQETTPEAEIDYAAEQLKELEPNSTYTINGTPVTAEGDGKVTIDVTWLGETLSIVKKGDRETTTDSEEQLLSLPSRPAAPINVTVTDVTYNGANDGSIRNVNTGMEFRRGNSGTWTTITGTTVDGLVPDVYYVRVAAKESTFASIPAQVTIHDSDATIPAAPSVSADDTNNVIVGLDTTMEFSVDGGAYVRYNGTNMPQLSGEHTVQVRVAASGSIPAGPSTTLIFTTNIPVPAGGLTITSSDPSGSANDGKTRITVTPAADGAHRLVYFNFGSDPVDVPNVGDTLSNYLNVPSDRMILAANGDKIGIAEVDAQGRVVRFGQTTAIVTAEPPGPQPRIETSTDPIEEAVEVLVNGKVENAGKATTTESGGVKTTTVVVDPAKLKAKLEVEGLKAVVTIPVKSASNVIVGELNGQMVKNMENLSATLVLQTGRGTYTLPAKEINIDEVASKLGNNVKLEDIQLKVSVAQTPDSMAKVVENAGAKGQFSVVLPALDFTVTGTYGGRTVEITTFNVYVERMVVLPDGIDPNKITTGVVVEPDGTIRHVPTKIVLIEGKYYAQINSLTNSTYTVVWHPLEFLDVANHWAKAAVNDMGSRMVIDGTGAGLFNPNRDITRAEFAAILVRGLGLKLENRSPVFSDVKMSDWFSSAINTAYAYKLISGYEDGTFRPNDKITRE
ncbi:S-layer homology domain-containing protein, partial [Cohnella soli]